MAGGGNRNQPKRGAANPGRAGPRARARAVELGPPRYAEPRVNKRRRAALCLELLSFGFRVQQIAKQLQTRPKVIWRYLGRMNVAMTRHGLYELSSDVDMLRLRFGNVRQRLYVAMHQRPATDEELPNMVHALMKTEQTEHVILETVGARKATTASDPARESLERFRQMSPEQREAERKMIVERHLARLKRAEPKAIGSREGSE